MCGAMAVAGGQPRRRSGPDHLRWFCPSLRKFLISLRQAADRRGALAAHPFVQAVIKECGFPLAAPSANLSNQVSPTNARACCQTLGGKIPLIVDGGQCQVGIESTVLDLTTARRGSCARGMIREESLLAAMSGIESTTEAQAPKDTVEALRSPGMLPRHYSPGPAANIILARRRGPPVQIARTS